jgi:hypothetical protein
MGTILFHNPWVRFYVFYVAALLVVWMCDYIRNPPATGARRRPTASGWIWDHVRNAPDIPDDRRTPPDEVARAPSGLPAACENPPQSVSKPRKQTDQEVEPCRGGGWFPTPADPTPALNKREE